jgi:hypothetical protein
MTMLINNWGVSNIPCNRYIAPECRPLGFVLRGHVDSHHELGDIPEGKNIVTSAIVKVAGKLAFTKSGSCYKLGSARREWLDYLESKGWTPTEEDPIPAEFLEEMGL